MNTKMCTRCRSSVERDPPPRFCPRCGAEFAGADPLTVVIDERPVSVLERFAAGQFCNLYRCREGSAERQSVFTIVRAAHDNERLAHESRVLVSLAQADTDGKFAAFFPQSSACVPIRDSVQSPPRTAAVRRYAKEISGPDELYTLGEVRGAYPDGIDARDMAWIWRRLLNVLGFAHSAGFVHAAIRQDHVLIEPRAHKLVLIGWSAATRTGHAQPALDLHGAANCMLRLLDPGSDAAILRHLERAAESEDAWRILGDFDRLIDAMWGPRQFRPFSMPPRGAE